MDSIYASVFPFALPVPTIRFRHGSFYLLATTAFANRMSRCWSLTFLVNNLYACCVRELSLIVNTST